MEMQKGVFIIGSAVIDQNTDIGKYIASEIQANGKNPNDITAVLTFFQDSAVKTAALKYNFYTWSVILVGFLYVRTRVTSLKNPYLIAIPALITALAAWKYYAISAKNEEFRAALEVLLADNMIADAIAAAAPPPYTQATLPMNSNPSL